MEMKDISSQVSTWRQKNEKKWTLKKQHEDQGDGMEMEVFQVIKTKEKLISDMAKRKKCYKKCILRKYHVGENKEGNQGKRGCEGGERLGKQNDSENTISEDEAKEVISMCFCEVDGTSPTKLMLNQQSTMEEKLTRTSRKLKGVMIIRMHMSKFK